MADELKRTALHAWHREHGARMGPFAGWDMPLQYEAGAVSEHRAVREQAGLFDISHMGQVDIRGADAAQFLDYVLSNDVLELPEGLSTYCLMCREDGGVLDDVFVYRLPDRFYVVVNASNTEKDVAWLKNAAAQTSFDVEITNQSYETSMFALQGPAALEVFSRAGGKAESELSRFAIDYDTVGASRCLVSRTGYTGEDGVEIYVWNDDAPALWERLLQAGSYLEGGLQPVGLAARDSLRFEPGFALYGHELDEHTTPPEARLKWACHFDRPFIGRDAILKEIENGLSKKLVTVRMVDRGMLREGYEVHAPEGEQIGSVVTGMYSPTLEWYYGNAYVIPSFAKTGTALEIRIRGRSRRAEVVKRPLYRPAYKSS